MADPIYIGVAWPYANGGLHLGHVAGSLLPPDIFRRAMRMMGHDVLMVSGSDCHGTPILLKAEAEKTTPSDVVARYHADHVRALQRLGIGFDLFTRTTTDNHAAWVQRIFTDLREAGYITTRTQLAPFDPTAGRFLPDRYVEGTCPHCGAAGARGDQCDACGKTLDPQELQDPRSKLNPETAIEFRETEHFVFLLSRLQSKLEAYVAERRGKWRPNTVNFTENWLREGLKDRPITRDLTWGIPIPVDGYEDKRIYVWFEAVCGYLTAAIEWADRASRGDWQGVPDGAHVASAPAARDADAWQRWWCDAATRAYYFLGKDNIPFHTIIWPAILIAFNEARAGRGEPPLVLPYDVPANEFLNLAGQQFSKSRGISIAVHDVLDRFEADAVRYYLAVNMPEQRDSDWTWDDFRAKVNDELVGILGNFVHRTLSFTHRNVGRVPEAPPGHPWPARADEAIRACQEDMVEHLRAVHLKKGARRLLEFAGLCNALMQEAAPWTLKDDTAERDARLQALLRLVEALGVFMAPYMPDAAARTWRMLALGDADASFDATTTRLMPGAVLPEPVALFAKLQPEDMPGAADHGTVGPAKQTAASGAGKGASSAAPATDVVTIDDFARLELRLAVVTSVEEHPKADKLYVLRLDVGELGERQVVAGLKGYYSPDELVGRTVAFVANLKPARLRGVESQGMILAADAGDAVAVLTPQRPLPPGSRIR